MKKTQTTQEVQEPSIEKEVQEVQKNAPDQAAQPPAREYLRKKYTPEEMEQGHCAATAQKTLEEIGIEKLQEIQRQAGEAAKMTDHTPDNPEYNPKTDPNNPLFDIEEWKKAAINELLETLNYTVKSAQKGTTTAVKHAAAMTPIITNAINAILQTAQTDTDAIKKEIFSLLEIIRENQELFDNISQDLEEFEQLKPYIEAEFEELKKDPQYSELTLDDILYSDEDDNKIICIRTQIIERAKQKRRIVNAAVDNTEIGQAIYKLPYLSGTKINNFCFPNNKLAQLMTQGIVDDGEQKIIVSKRKSKKKVATYCTFICNSERIKLEGEKPYTHLKDALYNGICSLYYGEGKQRYMTPAQIFRAANGITDSDYEPTEKIKETVLREVIEMTCIRGSIYFEEEAKMYDKSLESYVHSDSILSLSEERLKMSDGKTIKVVYIKDDPLLFEYARISGQIGNVSPHLLDVKEVNKDKKGARISTGNRISNNERRTSIKSFLLQRIYGIIHGDLNNKVLFDTMYNEIYKNAQGEFTDKEKRSIRKFVFQVLDYWAFEGFIKEYAETKIRGKVTGFVIYSNESYIHLPPKTGKQPPQ